MHRDVKSLNLLLSSRFVAKLAEIAIRALAVVG
jgi:hypothetical protein